MLVSVIIASKNEGNMLLRTVESIQAAAGIAEVEIIVVDDGSTDKSCIKLREKIPEVRILRTDGIGLAPARNLGAAEAHGEVLVFMDAHITVPDYWLDRMYEVIREEHADAVCPVITAMQEENPYARWNALGSAATGRQEQKMCGKTMVSPWVSRWLRPREAPFEVAVLPGGCFMIRREAFQAVGGYEQDFKAYGWDEEEISIKLWTFGFYLKAVPDVIISHMFRPVMPYKVTDMDIMFNLMYLAMCHYSQERVEALLDQFKDIPLIFELYREIFSPEYIRRKRSVYFQKRVHDDNWFFDRFQHAGV